MSNKTLRPIARTPGITPLPTLTVHYSDGRPKRHIIRIIVDPALLEGGQ